MLLFVTSLRHPRNSTDYDFVEQQLHETLRSVSQQSTSDFRIVVVGNEQPRRPLPESATFVPVNFGPPVPERGAQFAREPFVRDKGSKIAAGLLSARDLHPTHVMIFDADDFVHRDIAGFVAERPAAPGWFIDQGYMFSRARQSYREIGNFHRTCGTSHIVRWETYGVPESLPADASQQEIIDAYGERLPALLGAHRNKRLWLREHGVELARLPFRGAVYQVDTGENHSGKSMKGLASPLDRTLIDDFAVPRTGGIARAWLGAWGPTPAVESMRENARLRKKRRGERRS